MGFTTLECFTGEKAYLRDRHDSSDRVEEIVVDGVRYFVDPYGLPRVAYRFIRECTTRHEEAIAVTVTKKSTLRKIADSMFRDGYFYDSDDRRYVTEEDIEREYRERH